MVGFDTDRSLKSRSIEMPRLAHEIYKKRCYAAPNSDHQKGQGFENSSWQNQSLLTVEIKDEAACLILR